MKMVVMLPLLFFFCFSTLPAHNMSKPSYHSDEHALLAFKAAISVDPFNVFLDWSPNHTFCNWTAITCSSRRQRVVSLNIPDMGLAGTISPFLGNLSFLRVLDLHNNSFEGHIPHQLGRLFLLRYLRLSHNNLGGSIPPEFSLLPNLQVMALFASNLTGIIPAFLGNMSSLRILELGSNKLQGGIPAELGMLGQLTWLNLGLNNLRIGSIPLFLLNCTHLQTLELSLCNLKGPIPREFGRLSELQKVTLWQNELSGEIPRSVGNWTQLEALDLDSNQLNGTVPLELGNLQKLRRIYLPRNQLVSGNVGLSFITVLTNCSNLEVLALGANHLTGVLPTSVGRLSNSLSFFTLEYNGIEGNIPDEIGNLTNLATFSLEGNRLNGTIPSALGKLLNLERLHLAQNNLQGSIPESFGLSKRLGLLSLSENMLSGKIPYSLGELSQLRDLLLDHNQLSGEIPASLGRCQTLEMVDFAYNKLMGNLPPQVAGLLNLQIYFNISNNFLQGSILEMSKMVMVLAIDVSQNNFSGVIPAALASCKGLEYLNLSGNTFEGPIPASLADLPNLQYMDLSCNNLSGMIPMTFTKMKMLRHLNLSSNRLIGEVPKGGAFATLDASEIMGNLGLCGGWLNLPQCSHSNHKQPSIFKKVVHCDLKPSNVLLGDDMTAYIADFGLSKIIFGNSIDSLTSTAALKGSIGYIAPEYGTGGKLTAKGDVYSYGILILELLTRRRPTHDMFTEGLNLRKWVEMHFLNRISDVVDNYLLIDAHDLESSMVIECVTQFVQIGLFCTRESPLERPDMPEIVDRLNKIRGAFLGTSNTPQLPIDISPFLDNTRGINMSGSRNNGGSSTSTS